MALIHFFSLPQNPMPMRFYLLIFAIIFFSPIYGQGGFMPNQVLVRFEQKTDVDKFWRDFHDDEQEFHLTKLKNIATYMNIWKVEYEGTMSEREVVAELLGHEDVFVAQLNHKIQYRAIPNDPSYATQWQWQNVNAEGAWETTTGGVTANGDTIVVAVIDTGIQLDHPDLAANLWHNYAEIPNNGIDDDNNGYIDDYDGWNIFDNSDNVNLGGHGVKVSGMIGAVGNNANQGVGMNWDVKIMTIIGGSLDEAEVVAGYSYALKARMTYNETNGAEGAFVVATNSSWGADGDPADYPIWCNFYDTLGVHGILSCGATTNSANNVDVVGDMPTSCSSEYLISVTATDIDNFRDFSGYGLNTIDVAAPGDNIYTTISGSAYAYTSGTSFASPLTAGIVALLYSAPCPDLSGLALTNPAAAALQIRDFIFDGVTPTAQLQAEIKYGGVVNAEASMDLLMNACGACIPPFAIEVDSITDTEAVLTFVSQVDGVNLFIQAEGGAWDTIANIPDSLPYHFTGLIPCTNYTVVMQTICADSLSDSSAPFTFKTDGCCELPNTFMVTNIANETATLTWSSVLAATGYQIVLAANPYTTWDTMTVTGATMLDLSLMECMQYKAKIKTLCSDMTLDFGDAIDFQTYGCGACLDSVYCDAMGNNVNDEWIGNVSISGVFNNSSDDVGYEFFSGLNIELIPGQSYEISVTPAYSGTNYTEYVSVWIDINQNGAFEDEELVVSPDFGITETTTFSMDIIPFNASLGLTRMRVIMKYGSGADGPCGSFTYGEVEDYCIALVDPGSCVSPFNFETTDILDVSATLSFETLDSLNANLYYQLDGATEWDTVLNISSPYLMTGLVGCSSYNVIMTSICDSTLSNPSNVYTFNTIGCCVLPEVITASNFTDEGVTLTWDSIFTATSYEVIYSPAPFDVWDTVTVNNYSVDLTGLLGCTTYQVKVKTICSNSNLGYTDAITFDTYGCGACIDLPYCEAYGNNNSLEWVDSVAIIGVFLNETDSEPDGYNLFTDQNILLLQGASYTFMISPGFANTLYNEYVRVWVDYNQDGIFQTDELVVDGDAPFNSTTTYPLTIGTAALEGSTRMRVSMKYASQPDSCGVFSYGEVEDYCVTIAGAGTCLPPMAFNAMDILDTTATLSFTTFASSANLFYHIVGTTEWDTILNITSPYMLTGLQGCTDYEIIMSSNCDGETSANSLPYVFKTNGCCLLPVEFYVDSIFINSALAEWSGIYGATGYEVVYSAEPYTLWDTLVTPLTSAPILGLESCTNYKAKIRTLCSSNVIEFSEAIDFKTIGCTNCGEVEFCESFGNNDNYEWIDSLGIDGIFANVSGAPGTGYTLFTDLGIQLAAGGSYTLTLTPGYSGSTYNEYVTVWIDFDQNGVFDTTEVVVNGVGPIDVTTSFPMNAIPMDALPGQTRMRVTMKYASSSLNPCEVFSFGEVEDYCINIGSEVYCETPANLSINGLGYYTADLEWDNIASAISYTIRYKPVTSSDWNAQTSTINNFQLYNLDDCTDYEVELNTVCPDGLSDIVSTTFTTECIDGTTTPFGEKSFTIMPNPFTSQFEVTISGYSNKDIQVRLFDVLGKEIAIKSTGIDNTTLSIEPESSITSGVYLLQLKTADHVGLVKVVKGN